jgi:hypothetical protein
MSRNYFVAMVGVAAYLLMPIVLRETYISRGYFAIGGEWFIPLLAMFMAYALYEAKNVLRDSVIVVMAVIVLLAMHAWLLICSAVESVASLMMTKK